MYQRTLINIQNPLSFTEKQIYKKTHLKLQMLPFASPCLPDNIIPISEASNKNPKFKFFFNKYFVCFLAHFSTTSYVGNKVQPIIQSSFHQGSNILTQKFKIQKKNNNNTQIQTILYCGNKPGRPLPQPIADLRKSEPVSLKVLHWNVKVDASKKSQQTP